MLKKHTSQSLDDHERVVRRVWELRREAATERAPNIGVVILNWNGADNTVNCIKSLEQSGYPSLHVIVVDNASTERLNLDGNTNVELIRNRANLGFAEGMNVGIRRCMDLGADLVICLNNDVVVHQAFLRELADASRRHPVAAAFAPLELEFQRPSTVISAGGRIRLIRSTIAYYGQSESQVASHDCTTRMLCGACVILSAATIATLGGFEPTYFFGFEDRELGLRILRSGGELFFVPRCRIWHKRAQSTAMRLNSMRIYFEVRNWMLFGKRNFPAWKTGMLAFYLTLVYLPYILSTSIFKGKLQRIGWSLRGVLWHINKNLLPSDDQVAQLLARSSD